MRPTTLLLLAALLGSAALTFAPSIALADEAAAKRARQHFQKGEKLFALGRFEEALAQYEAAFDADPLPELLFNIGQCHRNLGDYDAAIFSFKKYLRQRPDADNRRAVEKLIDELEDERARDEARRPKARVPLIPVERDPTPPARDESRPVYTTWWFWTGLVVVAAGVGTAIYLWPEGGGVPSSDLGNIEFPR